MQKRKVIPTPLVMSLKKTDYWYWCRYFIDIYRQCPYGCSYCNTKKNYDFKGLKFIRGLPVSKEAVGLGLLSDIYHPDPSRSEIVTEILSFLYKRNYSVNILTKSNQIVYDLELLKLFSERKSIRITFTVLTLDRALSGKIEGTSPHPSERLDALSLLTEQGIPAGIAVTPIIPGVNDDEESLTSLVKEAKRRGSAWVIFSGFNPVSSFLNNPRWKATARLHTDTEKLNKQYRSIKEFMIRLLHEENLPMRIPRMSVNMGSRNFSSHIVSEYLFNISYLYELMGDQVESLRYRRAAHTVNEMQNLKSIVLHKKLGYIRGINLEIEKVIEEILSSGNSSLFKKLYQKMTA